MLIFNLKRTKAMKTRIVKFILIIVAFLGVFSCEDYLREENYTYTTGSSLVTTVQGMETMINSCYSCLRLWYGKEPAVLLSEVGTDIYTGGNHYISSEYATYNSSLNGSSPEVDEYWKYFYFALNTTNSALGYLPESPMNEDLKVVREGELKFLRALFLWHITEIWGDAPFTTEVYSSKVLTATKTSVDDLYVQIFEDLLSAEINLDGVDTQAEYGRVTIWTVRSMLARMYLYRKDYVNALKYANMVIDEGGFELAPSNDFLWDIANTEYPGNKEIIWSVIYSDNGEPANYGLIWSETEIWPARHGNNMHLTFLCYYQAYKPALLERSLEYGRAWVRFMPNLFLLDLYDETVDTRFSSNFREAFLCNKENELGVAIGDTVMYFSKHVVSQSMRDSADYLILDRNDMWDPTTEAFIYDRNYYFCLNKFLDPTRADKEDAHSGRDVFVFRLSEMYFIAGEAEYYLNGGSAAYPYFLAMANTRAVGGDGEAMLNSYGVTSDGSGIDIDFILDEKGREFCGEFIRWFDLKRTGKLVERVRLHNPDAAANIEDYHVVRPIPQSELDAIKNKDEFTQNPGYN